MHIGDEITIFVEATHKNRKQYWSLDPNTDSLILKEIDKPGINETFVLQKCIVFLLFLCVCMCGVCIFF